MRPRNFSYIDIFTPNTVLIRPKPAGTARLQTSNPRARPEIKSGFFSAPEYIVLLRKGMRLAVRLAE